MQSPYKFVRCFNEIFFSGCNYENFNLNCLSKYLSYIHQTRFPKSNESYCQALYSFYLLKKILVFSTRKLYLMIKMFQESSKERKIAINVFHLR